jgi:hypothetical protein
LNAKLESNLDYINVFKSHTKPVSNKDLKNRLFYDGFGIIDPKRVLEALGG